MLIHDISRFLPIIHLDVSRATRGTGGKESDVPFSETPHETGLNPDTWKVVRVESGGGGVCWIKAQWIKSSPGDCVRHS
jgi:hypothetical protein